MMQRYEKNTKGTDYAVGDIHGYFSALIEKLNIIGFDFENDRLFSVGDLVDRGPESHKAVEWIKKPWFFPVKGNHDDFVCRRLTVNPLNWLRNGGAWFQDIDDDQQAYMQDVFKTLPIVIEVETGKGMIGLVHADPWFDDWDNVAANADNKKVNDRFFWSRDRVENKDDSGVKNIDYVVVGHSPLPEVLVLGNVHHIDTAGWHPSGYFTILNLNTMEETK